MITENNVLTGAIEDVIEAEKKLKESNLVIEEELIKNIIPLSLYVKIKTNKVNTINILKQELADYIAKSLPCIDQDNTKVLYPYRLECKMKNGSTEYYFHQMYLDEKVIEDQFYIYDDVKIEFISPFK